MSQPSSLNAAVIGAPRMQKAPGGRDSRSPYPLQRESLPAGVFLVAPGGAALPGGPGGRATLFGTGETWGRLVRYGRPTAGGAGAGLPAGE